MQFVTYKIVKILNTELLFKELKKTANKLEIES